MTTQHRPRPLPPALAAQAQRLCQNAGTDLDTALAALTSGADDATVPEALRAGWQTIDHPVPADTPLEIPEATA